MKSRIWWQILYGQQTIRTTATNKNDFITTLETNEISGNSKLLYQITFCAYNQIIIISTRKCTVKASTLVELKTTENPHVWPRVLPKTVNRS